MKQSGALYIIATPIGNLSDMTFRAVELLKKVDVIAAEDTRHSAILLNHFGIHPKKLISFHEHNEKKRQNTLLTSLKNGKNIAVISDAGTPLINDSGYHLVRTAREAGINVIPIPGACAFIAALSAAGLPTDRFVFEGFLPVKSNARLKKLNELQSETRTLIFYETPHRIIHAIEDMISSFGGERYSVIARELTKKFETIHSDSLSNLLKWLNADKNNQCGEFVLLVSGKEKTAKDEIDERSRFILETLLEKLPYSQAIKIASRLTSIKKNYLYSNCTKGFVRDNLNK